MTDSLESVSYQEALSIRVGKFLRAAGFDLASSTGRALDSLVENNLLGVLYKDPAAKPRKYLFGLIVCKPRRAFLGTIWFYNAPRGATEDSWCFCISGRKYVELAKALAEEMALAFNVKVSIRLTSEEPDTETFSSDYGDI